MSSKRYVLFSIDTEPDNPDWTGCRSDRIDLKNLDGIPRLLALLNRFQMRPTFFISSSVAQQSLTHEFFDPMCGENTGEIGAHFHPGDTKPFLFSDRKEDNIYYIPDSLLLEKLQTLHNNISHEYGAPTSFRSGAWSIDHRIAGALERFGYLVDSSVTPGISWRAIGRPDYIHSPLKPFWLDCRQPDFYGASNLYEVPVSIYDPYPVRFIRRGLLGSILTMPLSAHPRKLHIRLIRMLRFTPPIWLAPAFTPLEKMELAAQRLMHSINYLHIMVHSNELIAGTSPYHTSEESIDHYFKRIEGIVHYAIEQGCTPITLREYRILNAPLGVSP